MKKQTAWIAGFALMLAGATSGWAAPHIYKWVKDKRVNSQDVLRQSGATRAVSLGETATLEIVKDIMTKDLFMALGEYHQTRHQQDGETTPDSVLPEEVVGQTTVDLVDEDYGFVLEVKLKAFRNRTRVTAVASPLYRIRDLDAEAAANPNAGGSTVDVKVTADENQAVAVGPVYVTPMIGLPEEYGVQALPDAADRAGKLVRSFMYFFDKRIQDGSPAAQKTADQ